MLFEDKTHRITNMDRIEIKQIAHANDDGRPLCYQDGGYTPAHASIEGGKVIQNLRLKDRIPRYAFFSTVLIRIWPEVF
jgi:hypothetical protein